MCCSRLWKRLNHYLGWMEMKLNTATHWQQPWFVTGVINLQEVKFVVNDSLEFRRQLQKFFFWKDTTNTKRENSLRLTTVIRNQNFSATTSYSNTFHLQMFCPSNVDNRKRVHRPTNHCITFTWSNIKPLLLCSSMCFDNLNALTRIVNKSDMRLSLGKS
jgi:hypothetical protein